MAKIYVPPPSNHKSVCIITVFTYVYDDRVDPQPPQKDLMQAYRYIGMSMYTDRYEYFYLCTEHRHSVGYMQVLCRCAGGCVNLCIGNCVC